MASRAGPDRPGLLAGRHARLVATGAEVVEHGVDAPRLGRAPVLVAGEATLGPAAAVEKVVVAGRAGAAGVNLVVDAGGHQRRLRDPAAGHPRAGQHGL